MFRSKSCCVGRAICPSGVLSAIGQDVHSTTRTGVAHTNCLFACTTLGAPKGGGCVYACGDESSVMTLTTHHLTGQTTKHPYF